MSLFRKLNAYELQNYQRRIPSTHVLTAPEAAMYTGIFASRGYDSANAYNYYGERVTASRTGYLRGLGDWWPPSTWGSPSTPEVDCEGMTPTQCAAARIAVNLPPGSEVEIDYRSTETTPTPPHRGGGIMQTMLWVGAGIVGLAIVARMMRTP